MGHMKLRPALVAVVAALVAGCGSGTSSQSTAPSEAEHTQRSSASASPVTGSSGPSISVESTVPPSPSPTGLGIAWRETGSFGTTINRVADVTRGPMGLVAVGTRYDPTAWDVFGPRPPHAGGVWLSADGSSWEAIEAPDVFADATLSIVFSTTDSSIIAIGTIGDGMQHEIDGTPFAPHAAWESPDGRNWHRVASGFPVGLRVSKVVQGERGYLALVHDDHGTSTDDELWFSSDGRRWELVQVEDGAEQSVSDVAAGDEGFVAIGTIITAGETGDLVAFASADGREWIASAPLSGMHYVAGVGPDWFGMSTALPVEGPEPGTGTLLFSANGLDWSDVGELRLGVSGQCRESASSLSGAGEWLFMHTGLNYPCSEGAVQTAGNQYVSADGVTWEALPFPYNSSHRIIEVDGTLIGAGHTGNRATFWIGDPQ